MEQELNDVTLQSQEGTDFPVPLAVATMSATVKKYVFFFVFFFLLSCFLRSLIEDAGTAQAIPLPNVEAQTLGRVIAYCKAHVNDKEMTEEERKKDNEENIVSPADAEFIRPFSEPKPTPELFALSLAANYLDIAPLLTMLMKTVANHIKGKTPEEIRATFNIKNDFTPEELEQIRKENEWCEEK